MKETKNTYDYELAHKRYLEFMGPTFPMTEYIVNEEDDEDAPEYSKEEIELYMVLEPYVEKEWYKNWTKHDEWNGEEENPNSYFTWHCHFNEQRLVHYFKVINPINLAEIHKYV